MRKTGKITLAALALVVPATIAVGTTGARAGADDPAVTYKKCVACHGAKAEKKFDASKSDDQLVNAILKGVKAEKPPNMPAYEDKGINADQAKALVAYMKSLKQ